MTTHAMQAQAECPGCPECAPRCRHCGAALPPASRAVYCPACGPALRRAGRFAALPPIPVQAACAHPGCLRPAQPSGACVRCEGLVARGLIPAAPAPPPRPDLALPPARVRYDRYALVQGEATA